MYMVENVEIKVHVRHGQADSEVLFHAKDLQEPIRKPVPSGGVTEEWLRRLHISLFDELLGKGVPAVYLSPAQHAAYRASKIVRIDGNKCKIECPPNDVCRLILSAELNAHAIGKLRECHDFELPADVHVEFPFGDFNDSFGLDRVQVHKIEDLAPGVFRVTLYDPSSIRRIGISNSRKPWSN